MINADTTTETTKSRSQECITPLARSDGVFPMSCPICPSVSTLSPWPLFLDAQTVRTQAEETAVRPLPGPQAPSRPANQFVGTHIPYITGGCFNSSLALLMKCLPRARNLSSPNSSLKFRGVCAARDTPMVPVLAQRFLELFLDLRNRIEKVEKQDIYGNPYHA